MVDKLEMDDLGWEERKKLEQELSKKKRRRESESLDDDRQVGERRKIKKLRYSRLGGGTVEQMSLLRIVKRSCRR